MNTITEELKSKAINGHINTSEAERVASAFDSERQTTVELLKECEKNVGMYLGEKILTHLAKMTGGYFNERDYHYEKPVGEQ